MRAADLHTHTTFSDGRLTPTALVRKAAERGLSVLAITDHDTIKGVVEAQQAGQACGIEIITGVELSVTAEGEELHLLGYDFDPDHEGLARHLARFKEARRERARAMAQHLTDLGFPLTLEDVEQQAAPQAALGRPHVAQALVATGHADSTRTAFDRFIGDGGPAFVEKPQFEAADALHLLHDAGGFGALAHPGEWTSDTLLRTLVGVGLDAIETVHPAHDRRLTRYWHQKARANDLRTTGGSDYHGHRAHEEEQFGNYTIRADSILD